ncbi:MAG: type III-B CRISPR-associated protein Cas10/Cmr2 [Verrucomicrobiia bacterium]
MNLWQCKLLAYLHDPPSKPFNITEHRQMAETQIRNAGFEPGDVAWFFDKVCDHTAAAADRVICPKSSKVRAEWNEFSSFMHPLGGGELHFEQPIVATVAERNVAALQPHAFDWKKVATDEERRDWARFFLHWRLWPQLCAEKHPSLAHMPADTRIPDHTIWTHCSLVSALQSCVKVEKDNTPVEMRNFQPAFLLVQIGPVQEFIAQARTTRDLWSGSYLLSWLIAHGIKAVTDEVGPDCVLYPALRGQPLFDFLHMESLFEKLDLWNDLHHSHEQILTPNLPNRFLAVLPAWEAPQLAVAVERAMAEELKRIADECAKWLKVEPEALARWNQQVSQFLTVHWQTWTWETDVTKVVAGHEGLQRAYEAATRGIPKEDLDPRNYRHQSCEKADGWHSKASDDPPVIDNPGFAWAAHYQKVDGLLAARRNTRDFDAWAAGDDKRDGAVKDMLSGKEEVVGSERWQKGLSNIPGHHFHENERLGAMNLIKRIWHRAYLDEKKRLKRPARFDSLSSIAAAKFAIEVADKLKESDAGWTEFMAFQKAAQEVGETFGATVSESPNEGVFLQDSDASIFHVSEWSKEGHAATRKALGSFLKAINDKPRPYVAVLAMDGDSMGQWVSGAKSPKYCSQLADETVSYFEKYDKLRQLLDTQRPVSPSYHVQLSEALANFAIYLAGPIVKCFDGQIIYAGGDDVLAMLPAESALPCARVLRMAFRGDPSLNGMFDGALEAKDGQWGFVGLSRDVEKLKRIRRFIPVGYPLIVPGHDADISAGIAIGHIHSPLQNLVEAARRAEKIAKREYRDRGGGAFAISLFKRSGETIQWGAKWDSQAIELVSVFAENSDDGKPLSAKFPYALARLLRAYAIGPNFRITKNNGFDPFAVFPAEFAHVVKQQGRDVPSQFSELAMAYLTECKNRKLDDFLGPFLTTTFINRGGGE